MYNKYFNKITVLMIVLSFPVVAEFDDTSFDDDECSCCSSMASSSTYDFPDDDGDD